MSYPVSCSWEARRAVLLSEEPEVLGSVAGIWGSAPGVCAFSPGAAPKHFAHV